jgi:hypothetical protein
MDEKQLTADLQQIINQFPQTTADPQYIRQNALTAYHNARADGLCHEGAWEIALHTLHNQTSLSWNDAIPGKAANL